MYHDIYEITRRGVTIPVLVGLSSYYDVSYECQRFTMNMCTSSVQVPYDCKSYCDHDCFAPVQNNPSVLQFPANK